jgi:hypothetical protein
MIKLDSKKIIALAFPIFILIFAWILAMGTLVSYNKLSAIFMTLPFILAFIALVLSVWFQHSRTFYAICTLLFTMCIMQSGFNRLDQKAFINGISLVIPIAFILLAVVEERGITTKHGLIKGLVLIVLVLIVLVDAGSKNSFIAKLKTSGFFLGNADNIQSIPTDKCFFICAVSLCYAYQLSEKVSNHGYGFYRCCYGKFYNIALYRLPKCFIHFLFSCVFNFYYSSV